MKVFHLRKWAFKTFDFASFKVAMVLTKRYLLLWDVRKKLYGAQANSLENAVFVTQAETEKSTLFVCVEM